MAKTLPDESRHASEARESIEALTRVAKGKIIREQTVREVVEDLRGLVGELPNALEQVGDGLSRSSENFAEFDREDQAYLLRAMDARDQMRLAAELALRLSDRLAAVLTFLEPATNQGPAQR
jgi:hypothetical protein